MPPFEAASNRAAKCFSVSAFIVWNAGKVGNYGSEGFEKAMEHVCGVEEGAMYVELNYEGYEIPSADCLDWLLSP